jgi:DNA-binding MarR family transcriptional regulator
MTGYGATARRRSLPFCLSTPLLDDMYPKPEKQCSWQGCSGNGYAAAMTTPTDDELAALGESLELFTRRYKLAEALGPEKPLNELDKQVLFFVAKHPECGPTDVARFLGVANTTISSATDRLAKRNLIERHRPETDRRAVALRLTSSGRQRVDSMSTMYGQLYRRMLEPLSVSERRQLIATMAKIISYDP